MSNEIVYCSIFLFALFVTVAVGDAAGDDATASGVSVLRLHSMDRKDGGMGMDLQVETDPGFKIFFFMKDVQVGKTVPVLFPRITESDPSRQPLPIKTPYPQLPLSLKALPSILRYLSIPPGSSQALNMENTLTICEPNEQPGQIGRCISSVDSLLDFAMDLFGSDIRIEIVRPPLAANSTPLIQNYTVVEAKEKIGLNTLPCHYFQYPYLVFRCHTDLHWSKNRLFEVSMRGENGDMVDAIFFCHMNTSQWNPKFYAFRQLGGIKPGMSEVCHFFPQYDLLAVVNIN